MRQQLHHATITLEHSYPASVEQVFSEFADPAKRAKWSTPLNDTLIYDDAYFREGGGDIFRCGPPSDLRFRGQTAYHVIVPNECVISTETLTEGTKRLAVALTTLDFQAMEQGAMIKMTIQLVSFTGPDMIGGYEAGNRSALQSLFRHLAEARS